MKSNLSIFLLLYLLLVLVSCSSDINEVRKRGMQREVENVLERYESWLSSRNDSSKVLLFHFITDVHGAPNGNERYIAYAAATDSLFHYDFMVNGGDIGLDMEPVASSSEETLEYVYRTADAMSAFPGVFLFCAGNHDWNAGEGRFFSSNELSDFFQLPSMKAAAGRLHIISGTCYGYYDVVEKHCRAIFLNSQSTGLQDNYYYVYDGAELAWLCATLSDTPDGWHVVIFSHLMPHSMGRWQSNRDLGNPSAEILMSILSDFVSRSHSGNGELEWDFSNTKARLVGIFCGDSHFNCYLNSGGVNYYVTQGYGFVDEVDIPSYATFADREKGYFCSDIIAVDLLNCEVASFRLGCGDAEYDVFFAY